MKKLLMKITHRKCTLRTHTVIHIDRVTRIIVNNKYFPSKGIAREVGGMISAKSKKNTVSDKRIEEQSDTCKKKTKRKFYKKILCK